MNSSPNNPNRSQNQNFENNIPPLANTEKETVPITPRESRPWKTPTPAAPKKRRSRLPLVTALTVLILCSATFLAFHFAGKRLSDTPTNADGEVKSGGVTSVEPISADTEMRGVWIATVFNTNFPSQKGLSESELKAELDDIVKTARDTGLNSIFFQAIPSSDALYASNTYPWSSFLSGTQGVSVGSFDPLAYITEKAHAAGIELHAWINPFRVTVSPNTELSSLAENHPARLHPEYCVKYTDGKYYYNPGLPEVREMIRAEVQYIMENYAVDGIHMDDYFYPYPVANGVFDDAAAFEAYGNGLSLEDWRRENVNRLVHSLYDTVKSVRPSAKYGVSPFGIYANAGSGTPVEGSETGGLEAYSALYCDAIAWAKGGYIDYLAPQIYWAFSTKVAPFDTLARWWNANLDGTGVPLYIGHALYRAEEFPANEIPIQVEFSSSLLCYKGSIFYGYAALHDNTAGVADKLRTMYSSGRFAKAATITAKHDTAINYPQNGYRAQAGTQYMLGSSDPSTPVTLNGNAISRTKNGYFSFYATLAAGSNSYALTQGGNTVGHTIGYKTPVASSGTNTYSDYKIVSTYPSGETWITGGDTVNFSCTAPAGSTVTVTVGGASATLKATKNVKNTSSGYVSEVYKGSIAFGTLAAEGKIIDLGTITFTAKNGSEQAVKRVGLMKEIGKGALIYAQVNKDYTHLKTAPSSSFYDDYTPTSAGMRDYIIGYENGYYKLRFGGYVSDQYVNVVEGQPLYENAILTAESEVVSSSEQIYKKNYTELRFGVLENVPTDVWVEGNAVTMVLYDTLPETMPAFNLCENPLFSSVTVKAGASGKTVLYTATLKDAENYYGFNLVYEGSFIKFRFNNPIGLVDGEKPLTGKTIYVDAGHGGTDIGAPGPAEPSLKLSESMLNLKIANSLAEKLEALGATVYTTRTTDETHDLFERLDMIDAVQPDILISVHHNSIADSSNAAKARGYLGLYSNNAGIRLAKTVSDTVCDELNRMQRSTAYQMLAMARDHRFPSTLCEMSFISNVEEFQWTVADGNIERSAQALCDGILNFFAAAQSSSR